MRSYVIATGVSRFNCEPFRGRYINLLCDRNIRIGFLLAGRECGRRYGPSERLAGGRWVPAQYRYDQRETVPPFTLWGLLTETVDNCVD